AGTFHAIAHRLLHNYGEDLGLAGSFSVLDRADAADLMGLVRPEVGEKGETRRRFPRKETLVDIHSRTVNAQVPLEEALLRWYPWCREDLEGIKGMFRAYTDRKRAHLLLDFDDLLLYWRAAADHAAMGPVLAGLYDHILVDEYQDTNSLQSDILRALRRRDRRITVVGDDAQAIYSFRAASVANLVDFAGHFSGSIRVALTRNFRSTQPILDLANAVIAGAGEGFAKDLWTARCGGCKPVLASCPDEQSQAEAVCDVVIEHFEQGIELRSQAVLFRKGHRSDLVELEMRRRDIPFAKYGGLRFLEAAHVRDLLALLRVLDNPWDEPAWNRVLQMLEGVGPATAKRVATGLGLSAPERSGCDPMTRFLQPDRPAMPKAGEDLDALVGALGACRDGRPSPAQELDRLCLFLEPVVRRRYEQPEPRIRDLRQLGHQARGYGSRSRLLADLALDPPASTGDFAGPPLLDEDHVVLSPVHSAKGGEWPVVHLIHAADGMFPSDMATADAGSIDEERRLFYVALTRARRHLYIYAPLRYHHRVPAAGADRHSYAQRTRFLPPELDQLLEIRPVRSPLLDARLPEAHRGTDGMPDAASAVDELLRTLW
ncbi:MAG: ATP-dependent helicase, partial [Acidimicrobiales bacterium]